MMKKILIYIFLFLPIIVSAQFLHDTLPSLSYTTVVYNDFTISEDWDNFNGATSVSLDASNQLLTVVSPGVDKGALSQFTNKNSTEYVIELNVLDVGPGIKVYSQWSTQIGTITTNGWHRFKFTSGAVAGGFGNKVILAAGGAGTFKVGFYKLAEKNAFSDISTMSQTHDISLGSASILGNSFDENISGVTYFGFTGPALPIDGKLDVTFGSGSAYIVFGNNLFPDTCTIDVYIDITVGVTPAILSPVLGAAGVAINEYTIPASTSGAYHFRMTRRGVGTAGANGVILHTGSIAGNIKVNSIKVIKVGTNINPDDHILVGKNASTTYFTGAESLERTVTIGNSASSTMGGAVTIGDRAQTGGIAIWGATLSGGELMAIGNAAMAGGWRTTALGAESYAAGQSSTAVGSGSEALVSHAAVFGRGAALLPYPWNGTILNTNSASFEANHLYLANGWASILPTPINSDQTRAEPNTIAEVSIHGGDAYDARFPAYAAGTTYALYDKVYSAGSVYYSLSGGNIGNTPASSPASWSLIMAEPKGAAATFNEAGRNLGLYAGLATGSGESGRVKVYVGTGNNGQNTKDTVLSALEVKSEQGIANGKTYVWIYNPETSTMTQVLVKKATNSGTNNIIGFPRLSL